MKYIDVIELIEAHYNGDSRQFFRKSLEFLKELKNDPARELMFNELNFILKGRVKIAPKREKDVYEPEMSFEEAENSGLVFVPQQEDK